MIKTRYICFLLLLSLFIPRVYAFTYELGVENESYSVKEGSINVIRVSLKNVQGTDYGISTCSLNITFDDGILLNSKISTLNSWTMMTGKIYLFDTANGILNDSDMFTIPVKVNNQGMVKITNIQCSDGEEKVSVSDKNVVFTIKADVSDNDINDNKEEDNSKVESSDNKPSIKSSNCNLSNISLSEGSIEFDPNVTEYSVKVNNLDEFKILPELEDKNATYIIVENSQDNKIEYEISVKAEDGSLKVYTLYASVSDKIATNTDKKKNNSYIPIFIGIICLLLFVNVFRIIKKRRK